MRRHGLQGNELADGKEILAPDETVPTTLTRRFDALGIKVTEQIRRVCRDMLVGAPRDKMQSAPSCVGDAPRRHDWSDD